MGSLQIQADYVGKAFEAVNSTGTGATVLLMCPALSETVPAAGFLCSCLSDQQNPITVSPITVADAAAAPNGQMVAWTTPNLIDVSISVLANSVDDFFLTGCALAVRKKAGLTSPGMPPPLWSISVIYPNAVGQSRLFSNFVMLTGNVGTDMATNARLGSKTFTFRGMGGDYTQGKGGF